MSKTKFTPGPWERAATVGEYRHHIVTKANRYGVIRSVGCATDPNSGFWPEDVAEANLSLMIAAPDLYEALKLLLPLAQAFEKQASFGTGERRGGAVFRKARAAIAKAEGGSKR